MARNFSNWLDAYTEYADFTESPKHVHYWVGVTLIAALLGRRVWAKNKAFTVFPNFYLMIVAPPDLVKKGTSLGQGIELLKMLDDFTLGPSTLTWQALIKAFKEAEVTEEVAPGVYVEMSNMFIASGEMGSFLNPEDRQCMDMLIKLWDGEEIDKVTVGNGCFKIEKPLLSFVTCTTPSWVRGSIPPYMIDGGLLSRIITLYTDKRERRVYWPGAEDSPEKNAEEIKRKLVEDLEEIRELRGECVVPADVMPFLKEQYDRICDAQDQGDSKLMRRKQVQIIKLSMVLAAATNSVYKGHLFLTTDLLKEAEEGVNYLEEQRNVVFKLIGKNKLTIIAEDIVELLRKRKEAIPVRDLYREVFERMPQKEEFNMLMYSMQSAGLIEMKRPDGMTLVSLPEK